MYQELNIFVGADLHSNTATSLTPPEFNRAPADSDSPKEHKSYAFRQVSWEWFDKTMRQVFIEGRPDIALWLGDLTEGSGERAESSEADELPIQIRIATAVVRRVGAPQNYFVRGTPVHSGKAKATWEDLICEAVGGNEIGDEGHYVFNDLPIVAKHFIGSTRSPVSKATAICTALTKQIMWAMSGQQRLASLILRAHTHTCIGVIEGWPHREGWIVPALTGLGSVYGSRCIDGLPVHFGFGQLRIGDKDNWAFKAHILPFEFQRAGEVVFNKSNISRARRGRARQGTARRG
jgi:hypothetical protein